MGSASTWRLPDRAIFQLNVAHGLVEDPEMGAAADLGWPLPLLADDDIEHPHRDRAGVHEIYRSWRSIADSYSPSRIFAGEVWVGRAHRLVRYVRSDELHTAFNFDYLTCPWRAEVLRRTIDETLKSHRTVNASPTWVLSNHDVPREVSRYAREQPDHVVRLTLTDLLQQPADLDLGLHRARAAALLMLALPGSAYLYQGEELGLAEVEDIPEDQLQDPVYLQTGGADRGRDGCRVPLPWEGDRPPFGYSPSSATAPPWLPQPWDWAELTVEKQSQNNTSTLAFYRRALQIHRELEARIRKGLAGSIPPPAFSRSHASPTSAASSTSQPTPYRYPQTCR